MSYIKEASFSNYFQRVSCADLSRGFKNGSDNIWGKSCSARKRFGDLLSSVAQELDGGQADEVSGQLWRQLLSHDAQLQPVIRQSSSHEAIEKSFGHFTSLDLGAGGVANGSRVAAPSNSRVERDDHFGEQLLQHTSKSPEVSRIWFNVYLSGRNQGEKGT